MSGSFHEFDDGAGAFDLRRWRRTVDRAARTAAVPDAITPFGFEVLRNRRYLRAPLKRLHVYTVARDRPTCAAFARALLDELDETAPGFRDSLAVVWGPDGPVYRSDAVGADRQLSIWPLTPSGVPLLARWGDYLAATPRAVSHGQLRESSRIERDAHALRYLLQLCIMQDALLGDRAHPLEPGDRQVVLGWIRALEGEEGPPPFGAQSVFDGVARPFAQALALYLERDRCLGSFVAHDFHGGAVLPLIVAPHDLEEVRRRACDRYRFFDDPSPTSPA